MAVLWAPIGAVVGTLNGLSLALALRTMRPSTAQKSAAVVLVTGGMRWLATVLLLVVALRTGAISGLLAAGGLWIAFRATTYLADTDSRVEYDRTRSRNL